MNRRIAMAFVIFTIVTTIALVGTENHDGLLTAVSRKLSMRQEPPAPRVHPQEALRQSVEPDIHFMPDEELIEDAVGLDPTPEEPDDGEIEGDTETSAEEFLSADDAAGDDNEDGPIFDN